MVDENRIAVFLAEFDYQTREIDRIYKIIQIRTPSDAKNPMPDEVVESIGYWLHNLYCAYEDLFKIICSFWENNITSDSGYHSSLVETHGFGNRRNKARFTFGKKLQHTRSTPGFSACFQARLCPWS